MEAVTGTVVLDGGLSTALEEQGADLERALWTARLLAEEPERIAEAHRAYFAPAPGSRRRRATRPASRAWSPPGTTRRRRGA